MAGNGPPPTPTAILRIRGSQLLRNRVDEPQPDEGVPEPKYRLNKRAKRYWDSYVKELTEIHVLTVIDGEALSRLCILCSKFAIERDTDRMLRLSEKIDKLSQQFGLTPASRARIKIAPKDKENAKRRFFGSQAG